MRKLSLNEEKKFGRIDRWKDFRESALYPLEICSSFD